jgi:hypothetical protein
MAQKIAFVAVRVLGTLLGVLGCLLLWYAQYSWPQVGNKHSLFMKLATGSGILFAIYFFYVAYLVWFRYSPLAVRHVVAVFILYLWSKIPTTDDRTPAAGLVLLVSLVAMYLAYRLATRYLNRLLFPTPQQV